MITTTIISIIIFRPSSFRHSSCCVLLPLLISFDRWQHVTGVFWKRSVIIVAMTSSRIVQRIHLKRNRNRLRYCHQHFYHNYQQQHLQTLIMVMMVVVRVMMRNLGNGDDDDDDDDDDIYYLKQIIGQWIVWSALVTASYLLSILYLVLRPNYKTI